VWSRCSVLKPAMICPACVPPRSPPPLFINIQDHELPGVPTSFSASSHPKPSLMMLHQRLCFDRRCRHVKVVLTLRDPDLCRQHLPPSEQLDWSSPSHLWLSLEPSVGHCRGPRRPVEADGTGDAWIPNHHWSTNLITTSTAMLVRCFVLWLLLLLLFIFFTVSPGNRVTNRRRFAGLPSSSTCCFGVFYPPSIHGISHHEGEMHPHIIVDLFSTCLHRSFIGQAIDVHLAQNLYHLQSTRFPKKTHAVHDVHSWLATQNQDQHACFRASLVHVQVMPIYIYIGTSP